MTTLILKLREQLSETIRAWAKFSGEHGDIAYFSDLSNCIADEATDGMRDAFKDLLDFEQKVMSMEELCKMWARTVSLL